MGRLLDRAFAEAAKLPETEQDAIAALVLAELDAERKWDDLFAKSQDLLSKLAYEARAEYRSGETEPLDPDKL
ncbi:MAG: hypothetical protein ABI779_12775 [Acidobacteriota bacterium]